MPSLNETLSGLRREDVLQHPAMRSMVRASDMLRGVAAPLTPYVQQYGPDMVSAADLVDAPNSTMDAGLTFAGLIPIGKPAKIAAKALSGAQYGRALAEIRKAIVGGTRLVRASELSAFRPEDREALQELAQRLQNRYSADEE